MLFDERKGLINGVNIAIAMIVHELHVKGLVAKETLAVRLELAAQQAAERAVQKTGGDTRPAGTRVDLFMLQNLAELLRMPTPNDTLPLKVLDGGRSGDADEQGERPSAED